MRHAIVGWAGWCWCAVQELGRVVPPHTVKPNLARYQHLCGANVLSNEAVNFVSVVVCGVAAGLLGPALL